MNDMITDEIFGLFPEFRRAVVVVSNIKISASNPRIEAFLTKAQTFFQTEEESTSLTVWDEAHLRFGSNPKKFPPSIRSLSERVRRGRPLPYINDVVAIMNAVSLRYQIPVGGDDLNMITGDLCLGLSKGNERFMPLGTTKIEHPVSNEVIYFDTGDAKVMCRRWNWRNGDETKITSDTTRILINADGLGDFRNVVEAAASEIAHWLKKECEATVRCDLLQLNRRSLKI